MLEISGPKHRSTVVVLGGLGWVLGYALVPGVAPLAPRLQIHDILGIHLFVTYNGLVLLLGRVSPMANSERTLRHSRSHSKASPQNEWTVRQRSKGTHQCFGVTSERGILKCSWTHSLTYNVQVKSNEEKAKKYNVFDLLKTPKLRKVTLIMWWEWIVNAMIYYGFSFNMSNFGGNFYLTFLLSGLVELPSNLLSALLLRLVGRRKLFFGFMSLTGVSCLAIIPSINILWLRVAFALIGKFGVTSAWSVMGIQGTGIISNNIEKYRNWRLFCCGQNWFSLCSVYEKSGIKSYLI